MNIPIYKIGDIVQYTENNKKKMYEYIQQHPGEKQPLGNLRIYSVTLNQKYNSWEYYYDYDWTSDGSALENDLVLVRKTY